MAQKIFGEAFAAGAVVGGDGLRVFGMFEDLSATIRGCRWELC
jgi:hypothetical protein